MTDNRINPEAPEHELRAWGSRYLHTRYCRYNHIDGCAVGYGGPREQDVLDRWALIFDSMMWDIQTELLAPPLGSTGSLAADIGHDPSA